MNSHIGIVACSAEGAALCYRTICSEAEALMGEHDHPEISMHTHSLATYMKPLAAGDWDGVAALMLDSTRKLAAIGATLAICPDNTVHEAFEKVIEHSPIPWIHIADAVANEAKSRSYTKLGITGTRYLMTGPVYRQNLADRGLEMEIPGSEARERINQIIFGDLVKGRFPEEARLYFNRVFADLKARGCDAAVMACTEIPLLVDPDDTPLPVLDSTRLLARAALRHACANVSAERVGNANR